MYRNLSLPWAKTGISALNKLHIKLYAIKQEEKEAVGVFLQRKYLLAMRLRPQATETQIVTLLLKAFKTSIKKVLRAVTTDSFKKIGGEGC